MKRIAIPLLLIMAAAVFSWSTEPMTIEQEEVRIWASRLQFPPSGDDSEVGGTMTYDQSVSCMYLKLDGLLYPVISPAGTRVAHLKPVTISLPGGANLAEGQSVLGGGGYYTKDFGGTIPSECFGPTGEVARFNATGGIAVR